MAKGGRPAYVRRFIGEFVLPHRWVCFLLVANVLLRTGLLFWLPYAEKRMVDEVLVPAAGGGVASARLAWRCF
jgi:hypothetical protein